MEGGRNGESAPRIFIGPEFGTVSRADLVAAAREAGDADFDVLIACAFNYEAHSTEFDKLGRIPVLKARMNADLHMAEDLKNTGKGNLFVIFGEPDIDHHCRERRQIRVKINGVDVFHPQTGEVRSDGAEGIACWFIDTDYNEESFFVRHAYFLGANDPYKSAEDHAESRNQRRSLGDAEQRHLAPVRETEVRSHRSEGDQSPGRRGNEGVSSMSKIYIFVGDTTMWTDHETEQDFLNFGGVARTVAEIIAQAKSRPVSIGVSGAWGVGKSSMIKLIRSELERRTKEGRPNPEGKGPFIFVEFNAWLYQGYDDARAALIEVVASALATEAEKRQTGIAKAKDLLSRVNWLRVAKLTTGSVAALALGLSPVGVIGEVVGLSLKAIDGQAEQKTISEAEDTAKKIGKSADGLIKPKERSSPPKEIHALRTSFEETLKEMGVTLIVLIDDLDRCLPETTISTLEAIRLLLFLKHTAFVIAADDQMIKHAVKRHFQGVDDDLVTNYFDKLIQVPIRVPPLGTQEVRAYMMLLFIENSSLESGEKERIREKVCEQLGKSWQGKRVDLPFLKTLNDKLPDDLVTQLDLADRLAPLMTTATRIAGNPRLIKRFLNALSIRMAMSRTQGVGVDESVLAKMLLFERCGDPKVYAELVKSVTESDKGHPVLITDWEKNANIGEAQKLDPPWDSPFIAEWLRLPPRLAGHDLRGVLYVSREHAPLILPQDRLSSETVELLTALLEHPDMAGSIKDRLTKVPRNEIPVVMDKLLDRARQEQDWGVPPILEACLVVANVGTNQGQRLASFLKDRPRGQTKANIVPKIGDHRGQQHCLKSGKVTMMSALP